LFWHEKGGRQNRTKQHTTEEKRKPALNRVLEGNGRSTEYANSLSWTISGAGPWIPGQRRRLAALTTGVPVAPLELLLERDQVVEQDLTDWVAERLPAMENANTKNHALRSY
jgi:hypothetical protein